MELILKPTQNYIMTAAKLKSLEIIWELLRRCFKRLFKKKTKNNSYQNYKNNLLKKMSQTLRKYLKLLWVYGFKK